jgi:hypothetical protein
MAQPQPPPVDPALLITAREQEKLDKPIEEAVTIFYSFFYIVAFLHVTHAFAPPFTRAHTLLFLCFIVC